MKWSDLHWCQKVIEILFGGCPGCKYEDRDHVVEMSIIHINQRPKSPPPSRPPAPSKPRKS